MHSIVSHRPSAICTAATLLALLGFPPASAAQATGSIVGIVMDASRARLPGVTVTITSPALIRDQESTTTNPEGAYRFASLPPGEYTVVFDLSGFRGVKREGVRVQAGQTFAVDATLEVGGLEQRVDVVGAPPLIDVKNAEVNHTVGTEFIENVPVARRFTDVLNTLPGVTNGLYTFSPANTVYGSSVRENVYTVDGLNFVDPVVRTAVTDVPFNDIAEVKVTTAGYAAEFGQAAGGIFNFVTKSGGNTFSGIANFNLQDSALEASNVTDELRRQGVAAATSVEYVRDWGANLGGPIVRNRVWFFQSYAKLQQEESQTDFPAPITIDQWQTLSKITAQLSPNNRIEGSYSRRDREFTPFNFGFATAADRRTWIGIGWINDAAGFGWTSTPTPRSLLEVRGGFTMFDLLNLEPFVEPGHPVYIDVGTGLRSGGPDGTFGTNHRDRYEWKADYSYYLDEWRGSHKFKGGFHWELLLGNTFRENQGAADDTHHILLNGQPFRVLLWNTPLRTTAGLRRLTGYLQDEWSVHDRLTINAGVRIENSVGYLPESEFFGGRWTERRVISREDDLFSPTSVAPRFGLVWDIAGNRRTIGRFSIGRFYHALSNLEVGVASPTSVGRHEFDWIDRNGDTVYQPGEEGVLRSDTTGAVPGRIDPNLKVPYTNMISAGVDREIGSNFALSVNVIYKNERDIIETTDTNIPFSAYNPVQVVNPLDNSPLTIYTLRPEFLGIPAQRFLTNPTDPLVPIRRYRGLEFVLRKRMSNRTQMLVSYNLGKAESHLGTLFFDTGNSSLYLNPNLQVNAFGPTSLDRTHMFKFAGTYQAPAGFNLSLFYSALSGVPWLTSQSGGAGINGARVVRFFRAQNPGILTETFIDVAAEPRGGNRHEAEHKLDVRVEKAFTLGPANLALQADVYNLLNANTIIRLQSLRTDAPNFLRPAQLMLPRAARLGVRVSF